MKLEGKEGEITMRGMIGDFQNGVSADDFMDLLNDQTGDVTIYLDSEGGCVTSGISMYNQIREYDGGEVTVHIDSQACSIATVVACAADRVVMNNNALFFVHNAWTIAAENAKGFREVADILDMLDVQIAEVYAERCGKSAEECKKMMDDETWMNAEQAVEMGFVDAVYKPKERKKPAKAEASPLAVCPAALHNKANASAKRMRLRLSNLKR